MDRNPWLRQAPPPFDGPFEPQQASFVTIVAMPGESVRITVSDDAFRPDEDFARQLDVEDPLRPYRDRFHIPRTSDGREVVYLAGNSLGLQPRGVREIVEQELDDWARFGVDAHFEGRTPWYSYHEVFRETGARLVGALPGEVVMMNSLTVNLHLMMATFYRPTSERYKIMVDAPGFPSDTYAVKTQLRHHGYDPVDALISVQARAGEHGIRIDDIEAALDEHGRQTALVLFNGLNFFTGQLFDMQRVTALAQRQGCAVGLDLAHAAGNVVLALHDWNVDFAVWCSYKYLNSGPGAVAGCFVHQRHGNDTSLPRLAGWWGNDPDTRFRMQLQPEFVPRLGADGWQVSNPPILAMAPLQASLAIFDEATMPALRAKSLRLTGYLHYLLDRIPSKRFEVITPSDPARRGCQLSILAHHKPKELFQSLESQGVVGDFREPNVIRVAPVPLYNTFHDAWSFAQVLAGQ